MRSPSACASASRRNATTPAPEPKPEPLAASSKARHRPSGEASPPERCRGHDHRGAAGQGQVALVVGEALRGHADRDERAGAGALHGHRRAGQAEPVRHLAGQVVGELAADESGPPSRPGRRRRPPPGCPSGGRGSSGWPRWRRRRRPGRGSVSGSCPASSSASQAVSRNNRCCGSVRAASSAPKPKNSASKSATPSSRPVAAHVPGVGAQAGADAEPGQLLVGVVVHRVDAGAQVPPEGGHVGERRGTARRRPTTAISSPVYSRAARTGAAGAGSTGAGTASGGGVQQPRPARRPSGGRTAAASAAVRRTARRGAAAPGPAAATARPRRRSWRCGRPRGGRAPRTRCRARRARSRWPGPPARAPRSPGRAAPARRPCR